MEIGKTKITFKSLCILNPYGELWSHKTFSSVQEAESYMELFWGKMKNPPDMSKHCVVPVTVIYKSKLTR